jgi:UDP-N-acetylmuramate: L-alanyl-gamma-D-glutamyl-meso-diaminopimelate ligase
MSGSIQSVHFVGICGAAMAGTAAALTERGIQVTGSDQNVYPPMSTFLEGRRIPVLSPFAAANLDYGPDLVVIGNALSRGNPEVEHVLNQKMRYASLPEVLKEFFLRGKRSIVVTGTHGKTTVSALLAWLLEHAGLNPGFLIGGIPGNFVCSARFTSSPWFVIEGDEYDTAFFDKRSKFVHYLPEIAIINNLEFDHADIFENLSSIQASFRRFIQLIPQNGLLLANGDDPNLAPLLSAAHSPVRRFGLGRSNDLQARGERFDPGKTAFELEGQEYWIGLTGELNLRNALAAAACARHCGLEPAQIQEAFACFKGIKRRMEVRGETAGIIVLDDFGHHPTALRETIKALRIKYPGRRLLVIFEPRSNTTRRKVLQNEIAQALAAADLAVISEVARLELLSLEERCNPAELIATIENAGTPAAYLPDVESIVGHVAAQARSGDVVCVFSNGGFGGIHQKLLEAFSDLESEFKF